MKVSSFPVNQALSSRNDINAVITMPTPNPIGGEIIAVHGENLEGPQLLCGNNEGSIDEIHRMIRIFFHQFKSALKARGVEEKKLTVHPAR